MKAGSSRIKALFDTSRKMIDPQSLGSASVYHYSLPAWHEFGSGRVEQAADLASGKLLINGGEILVSKLNPEKSVVISAEGHDLTTLCSPEFVVLIPKDIVGRFGYYLMLSAPVRAELQSSVESVTNSHKRARVDKFLDFRVAHPDFPTQTAIATFLDRETARIDDLIAKKERLVAVLESKRSTSVLHCLAHGLSDLYWDNRDFAIRFSLKEPAWSVRSVGSVVSFMTSGSRGWSDLLGEDGEGFIQSGHIGRRMEVNLTFSQRVQPQTGAEADRTLAKTGDVLVCITGGRTGAVGIIRELNERAYINQHICLLRANQSVILPELLAHMLWSEIGQKQIEICQYGLKQGLGFREVAKLRIPVPPLQEQAPILAKINHETAVIDALTERIQESLLRLREFRAALITAAVTGQIDVATWTRQGVGASELEAAEQSAVGG